MKNIKITPVETHQVEEILPYFLLVIKNFIIYLFENAVASENQN